MRAAAALALGLIVVAAGAPTAPGASLTLSERERQEALRVGQRSVTVESFDTEWRVVNGTGESVTVMTPFHRLALAARHAAFKNEALKPQEQAKALGELQDRLMVRAHLHGAREDFARHLRPRLRAGDRELQPMFVQNERTAVRREGGGFLARCEYWFSTKELTGDSPVELFVHDADEKLVARFAIDLARMR